MAIASRHEVFCRCENFIFDAGLRDNSLQLVGAECGCRSHKGGRGTFADSFHRTLAWFLDWGNGMAIASCHEVLILGFHGLLDPLHCVLQLFRVQLLKERHHGGLLTVLLAEGWFVADWVMCMAIASR